MTSNAATDWFDRLSAIELAAHLCDLPPCPQARRRYESELSYGRYDGPPPPDARAAAVVVLLYPTAAGWSLPLIVRPPGTSLHAGQISLPGGAVEPREECATAARRELQEELGVVTAAPNVIGRLSELYIFASNFVVTPWVAVIDHAPDWQPQPTEVVQVLPLALRWLTDPRATCVGTRRIRNVAIRSPYIAIGSHQVWGATSLILGELIAVLHGTGGPIGDGR